MTKNIESKLEMLDLFFSDYSMKYNKKPGNKEINTSFKIKYAEKKDDKNQVRIQIETDIKDDQDCLQLNLTTLGFFRLNRENMDDEMATAILRKNTVAIMFPFIRSQVSLLTTQPGMTPIMLQPIDINALVDNGEEETNE